ncbi:MAG: UMP kinase [Methanobrevibacter sp.]|jgi:uridylate kinase|nr:UMP kinase [Candidatus Methanoflexus mossambicus]
MKIVVAVGGSILLKENTHKRFTEYGEILKSLADGHEIFVIVGGGRPARDYIAIARDLDAGEAICDDIGIEVTRLNARLLTLALGEFAYPKIPHNFQEANEFSAYGRIVVMGGTEPAHSTDAVGAILAEYVNADLFVNLTSVDGMYDKDPNKFEDAKLIKEITADDMLDFLKDKNQEAGTYEFFDTTAIHMIKRSKLKTVIVNGFDSKNLIKAINDENVGTKIIN